jgi:outer membrane protein insertion porin family
LELALPGVSDLEYYKLRYNGQIFFALTNTLTLRLRTELGYGDGFGDAEELPFYQNFFAGGFGSVRGFKSNTLGPRSTPAEFYSTRLAYKLDPGGDPLTCGKDGAGNCITPSANLNDNGTPTNPNDDYYPVSYWVDPNTGKILTQQVYSDDDDPFGGNVLIEGGAELLFPLPFVKDQRSLKSAFYFDIGNVFSTNCRSTQINCSDVDLAELRYAVGVGVTWITGFGPLTFSYSQPFNDNEFDETETFQFSLGKSF